jgi:hypothetical protein
VLEGSHTSLACPSGRNSMKVKVYEDHIRLVTVRAGDYDGEFYFLG